MYIKKTIGLIKSNYPTHLKCLLVQALAICLIAAVFGLFFINLGNLIYGVIENNGLIEKAQELISDLIRWDSEAQANFTAKIFDFVESIRNSIASIPNLNMKINMAAWFFLIASYFVYFLIGIAIYPTFFCVNQFMKTNSRPYYLWAVVKKFVDSIRQMALRALLCMIMDWACLFLAVGVYFFVLASGGIFGIIAAMLIWIAMHSIRNTLFAYWLPVNINKTPKVGQSFKMGIVLMLDNFWRLFLKTLIVVAIFFALEMIIISFFVPIVIVVLSFLLYAFESYILNCVYFVNYFEQEGKPYFVKKVLINANDDD